MNKLSFLITVIMLLTGAVNGQVVLKGKVFNAESGQPLSGATVQLERLSKFTTTDNEGMFEFTMDEKHAVVVKVSYVGYLTVTERISEGDLGRQILIPLFPEVMELEDVVVSATRSRRTVMDYPARIEVINRKEISAMPILSADELLRAIPGVSVSRSAAFLSSSTVSLRGMGSEQGRTLVLIDGVPVNKSDGGSVNWNAIGISDIQQVEVIKGPGSSIYGGNAMGGIINLITPVPEKSIQGGISQSAGTFNTYHTQADFSGRKYNFYWGLNGMYRTSDGYITTPAEDIDEYSVDAFLDEYQMNVKGGYMISSNQNIEFAGGFYSGKRGTGSNYKGYGFENDSLASDDGGYNLYEGLNGRIKYHNNFSEKSMLNVTLYGQRENYQNIRESFRNNKITRYDVESIRSDLGLLSALNFSVGQAHAFTAGIDVRNGAVDGNDVYITSTDKVINKGKMVQAGFFIQDEMVLFDSPWRVLAGLRFDYAGFYDGSFIVEEATNETAFLQNFAENLDDANFSSISPRISLQYHKEKKYRIYTGYSRGFRPAVLDDMCRTGRISGGMKLANPELTPEYIDNVEIGGDVFAGKILTISPSVYYSMGRDYHAYIATGDSLEMNNKIRPIRIKDNIGKVDILGAELAVGINITPGMNLALAYSKISTEIIEYKRFNIEVDDDLEGKALVYQPEDLFHSSFTWKNQIVNLYIAYDYKGAQWTNDINSEEIEAYGNIDVHLWRNIYKGLAASLKIHNLLDDDYVDSRNLVSPGRMITAELSYRF
ncbi:MAG TPA: TonB-dependent receptor [Bacteroidales bacterium]|nr:TonB-dependent receptor [Bacteroidales bacterium]